MDRFPWLSLFDRKAFFIIALASFLIALLSFTFFRAIQASDKAPSVVAEEKRWPLAKDVQDIEAMQLFGVKQQVTKVDDGKKLSACSAPESDEFYLSVPRADIAAEVHALVLSTHDALSVAVIAVDGHQQLYSKGDTLPNGGEEIIRILPDRVIIKNDGYCSALMFTE